MKNRGFLAPARRSSLRTRSGSTPRLDQQRRGVDQLSAVHLGAHVPEGSRQERGSCQLFPGPAGRAPKPAGRDAGRGTPGTPANGCTTTRSTPGRTRTGAPKTSRLFDRELRGGRSGMRTFLPLGCLILGQRPGPDGPHRIRSSSGPSPRTFAAGDFADEYRNGTIASMCAIAEPANANQTRNTQREFMPFLWERISSPRPYACA